MQKILLLLAFVCLALPALNAQKTARRVEVFFTHAHTKSDLMNIQGELKAQKIVVDYTHMAFDEDGHLTELNFSVECPDGTKGSAGTTDVPEDTVFGFYWDPRPGAEKLFAAGDIVE